MKNYWEIIDKAGKMALTDLEFRKELIKDGNKAIKDKMGEDLPAKATFHESDEKNLVFVLPLKERDIQEGDELNEDELESVAGGKADGRTSGVQDLNISGYAVYSDV